MTTNRSHSTLYTLTSWKQSRGQDEDISLILIYYLPIYYSNLSNHEKIPFSRDVTLNSHPKAGLPQTSIVTATDSIFALWKYQFMKPNPNSSINLDNENTFHMHVDLRRILPFNLSEGTQLPHQHKPVEGYACSGFCATSGHFQGRRTILERCWR